MIQIDISNIWGELSLPDLLAIEKEVFAAHAALADSGHAPGWLTLPGSGREEELHRIQSAANRIRENSDIFVVVGIGGSSLGARAAIELLQGPNHNIGSGKGNPGIYFAGNDLSTRHWNELCHLLEGKDFSIAIVSKSGSTIEPSIAARNLRWMLERKYGTQEAKQRIYAVTDPVSGSLRQMAQTEGWECFDIAPNVGGRFSVLTAAGLLPMAVSGIDILEVEQGAAEAKEAFNLRSLENPCWLYAAVRNLMYRNGRKMELLESGEPGFTAFAHWWQQLFSESEGKKGRGLIPMFSDLHTLNQQVQQGERILFETTVRFDAPDAGCTIVPDARNLDGLNYLAGQTLDFVEQQAYLACADAHADDGISIVAIDAGSLDQKKVGQLFYFWELSCALSASILGVDPFNQPGIAPTRQNLYRLLGKPGYDNP